MLNHRNPYSVDAHLRIYQQGNSYIAELKIDGMHTQRFCLGVRPPEIEALNRRLQCAVDRCSAVYEGNRVSDKTLLNLAVEGNTALNRIFPQGSSRQIIERLQGVLTEGATIEISSEDFFIPWELLYSGSLENGRVNFFNFWGARYIIARTLIQNDRPSDMVSPVIEAVRPKVGLVTYRELPYVASTEIPALKDLQRRKRIFISHLHRLHHIGFISHYIMLSRFVRFITSKKHIMHFACLVGEMNQRDSSYLRISNDFDISMEDFDAKEFKMKYPFIILNVRRTVTRRCQNLIDGAQQRQLREAFLSAFPTPQDLERMVSDQLNENITAVVGNGSLEHIVFELIRWSLARGRLEELVIGARRQNSQNPQLRAVAELLELSIDQNITRVSPLRTSNWVALFLKYGARGVLATECRILDEFAAAFISSLYDPLLSGVPIGEALWRTRRHFWKENRNPLGLAYALYSPLAVRIEMPES